MALSDAGNYEAPSGVDEARNAQEAVWKPRKSAVRVRLPEERDWPALRKIVRRHHARTIFANIPFSECKLYALEAQARDPAAYECLLVAEATGQVVGMAWVSAGEYLLSDSGLMTTVHLVAVDVEQCSRFLAAKVLMRLIRGIIIWSESREAQCIFVHNTTGLYLHETDKLLRASGAILLGGGIFFGQK